MEDSGQQIYMARCAMCHGENREGREGMYPALAGSEWVDGAPERLAAIILDGIQGRVGNYEAVMPGWGPILQDAEIAAVMTWLRRGDGKGPVTAVEVNHARIETAGRNTFWTAGDLRSLRLR
jgi:mono/diheme cytochrome c family protein